MKIKHTQSWRVDGKYYHSINTAIEAVVERITCNICINAYRRRHPYMYHNNYDYDAFYARCRRRVTKVMHANYDKKLV